ncbi:hypothetical protein KCP74_08620 [Salmonella enterica subsp. enterica]|nr:hypothetical protein KCP74_08620 [Salmonella enterica subsp. enterica]
MCNSARNDADSQFIRSNLQDANADKKPCRTTRCCASSLHRYNSKAFLNRSEEYMKTDGTGGYRPWLPRCTNPLYPA